MNDDYVITLADISDAGFCFGGSVEYMAALGLTMEGLERGEITLGSIRGLKDGLVQRIVRMLDQRSQQRPAESRTIVRPGEFFALGWTREGLREKCDAYQISWDDVRWGRMTLERLKESENPRHQELVGLLINNRALRG